nr:hypothetical protein [Burkholderia orbicola]
MAKHTQHTSGSQTAEADIKGTPGLDDRIQQGAQPIIQQAIEAELAAMLEQYSNVKTTCPFAIEHSPVIRQGTLITGSNVIDNVPL